MAAVDASIGIKTAVNFHDKKNKLGTYSPPLAVFIDKVCCCFWVHGCWLCPSCTDSSNTELQLAVVCPTAALLAVLLSQPCRETASA